MMPAVLPPSWRPTWISGLAAGLVVGDGARDAARQVDHQAERQLDHRLHEARLGMGHQHARFGGGGDVDVADVDGAAHHHLEPGQACRRLRPARAWSGRR